MGTTVRFMDADLRYAPGRHPELQSALSELLGPDLDHLVLQEVIEKPGTGAASAMIQRQGTCDPWPDGDVSCSELDLVFDSVRLFDPGSSITWFDEDDFSFWRVSVDEAGGGRIQGWYPSAEEIPFK